MAKPKVKLNVKGITTILTGRAARAKVQDELRKIAEDAGPGFEARMSPHPYTSRGYVNAKTYQARAREARDRVLTRAVNARTR